MSSHSSSTRSSSGAPHLLPPATLALAAPGERAIYYALPHDFSDTLRVVERLSSLNSHLHYQYVDDITDDPVLREVLHAAHHLDHARRRLYDAMAPTMRQLVLGRCSMSLAFHRLVRHVHSELPKLQPVLYLLLLHTTEAANLPTLHHNNVPLFNRGPRYSAYRVPRRPRPVSPVSTDDNADPGPSHDQVNGYTPASPTAVDSPSSPERFSTPDEEEDRARYLANQYDLYGVDSDGEVREID